jgi:hypothetical protein
MLLGSGYDSGERLVSTKQTALDLRSWRSRPSSIHSASGSSEYQYWVCGSDRDVFARSKEYVCDLFVWKCQTEIFGIVQRRFD